MPPGKNDVTRAAFDAAVRKAKATGKPAPVLNRAGEVAYYVDQAGATVDAPREPAPGSAADKAAHPERYSTDASGALKAHQKKIPPTAEKQKATAAAAAQQQATAAAVAKQQAVLDALNGSYVWVDGHRRQITQVANKNGQLVLSEKLDGKPTTYMPPTAYGALNGDSVPGQDVQFLMAQGQADIFGRGYTNPFTGTGAPVYSSGAGAGNFAAAEHSAETNTVSNASNFMTIGNALQWLVNLSATDSQAYGHLVDQLHDSGYLNDNAYAGAGGGYSQDVALAFARAAQDVAVLNQSTNEKAANTTLSELLDQKAAAYQQQLSKLRAASFQPTERDYTDPAAVRAAARDAARAALGRALTPDEEARLTAHFHDLESQKFDAIDAAHRSGAAATVTDPNAAGQIDTFLNTGQLAQEQANYSVAEYGGVLRKLFGLGG